MAHLKLCASRAFMLVAYPTQGHEMLFDAQAAAYAHGRPFDGYVEEPGRVSSTCLVTAGATATRCPASWPAR